MRAAGGELGHLCLIERALGCSGRRRRRWRGGRRRKPGCGGCHRRHHRRDTRSHWVPVRRRRRRRPSPYRRNHGRYARNWTCRSWLHGGNARARRRPLSRGGRRHHSGPGARRRGRHRWQRGRGLLSRSVGRRRGHRRRRRSLAHGDHRRRTRRTGRRNRTSRWRLSRSRWAHWRALGGRARGCGRWRRRHRGRRTGRNGRRSRVAPSDGDRHDAREGGPVRGSRRGVWSRLSQRDTRARLGRDGDRGDALNRGAVGHGGRRPRRRDPWRARSRRRHSRRARHGGRRDRRVRVIRKRGHAWNRGPLRGRHGPLHGGDARNRGALAHGNRSGRRPYHGNRCGG
ncbi:hypothetical protein DB31_1813 [Hyalangium minutum]|uniref:Uncharacterized protein n=1 Tax=Hyalangium minutum TaxID=394096 RepID=A0A085WAT2_9BACT|nr:hypothetical protein DB31_1813 [Hyalangium minutum]